ncbi:pilus assembly protein [Novosphingobium profundi]|uniref:TadE family protein n=1 Tax=Novosphingobium profundi TaxID=1774954 RepID=UPI001BDA380F|nr:TadE/TadG family type IV pilus assembly protein [Novosphingobium profundi]MBT0671297.1 pilus assembly protein [Novosphingobium profundi]
MTTGITGQGSTKGQAAPTARTTKSPLRGRSAGNVRIASDTRGAVLVEAALALPVLITLLLGVITYAGWFMAAHTLQQVANEAARASVEGLDALERRQIVDATVADSVLHAGTLDPDLVTVRTGIDGQYFRVTLSYDVTRSGMFQNSLVPLPGPTIDREATVQLPAM